MPKLKLCKNVYKDAFVAFAYDRYGEVSALSITLFNLSGDMENIQFFNIDHTAKLWRKSICNVIQDVKNLWFVNSSKGGRAFRELLQGNESLLAAKTELCYTAYVEVFADKKQHLKKPNGAKETPSSYYVQNMQHLYKNYIWEKAAEAA